MELKFFYDIAKEPLVKIVEKNVEEIQEIVSLFKEEGLDVFEPENGIEYNAKDFGDRYEFNHIHENMTFRFYVMKTGQVYKYNYQSEVKKCVKKFKETIKRHFDYVKEIYSHCEKINEGPLWTMCGGGAQLQQFYGDDNGYIATLYLDMENSKSTKAFVKEGPTMVVNGLKNDIKFESFKPTSNMNVKSHKEVYGQSM